MRPIEYRLPRKRQPVFACFKGALRLFIRKVRVVTTEPLPEPCLYLCNHANKMGPMIFEMYFPQYHVCWGAHEMLGNYGTRRVYLREVFYVKKNGCGPRRAALLASFEALFSGLIYRGIKVLPTYPDGRLIRTVKKSAELLKNGVSVMIFPENSEDGYHEVLTGLFPGFALVMELFRRIRGRDIPVCPVYYHKKKRLIVAGKVCTLAEFREQGMTRTEMAEVFRQRINDLYFRIEAGEFDPKPARP